MRLCSRGTCAETLQIRDYMVDIKDMLRVVQQKEGQNNKEGIHPNMKGYLKNDLDTKLR